LATKKKNAKLKNGPIRPVPFQGYLKLTLILACILAVFDPFPFLALDNWINRMFIVFVVCVCYVIELLVSTKNRRQRAEGHS
jgi:hypothetical protein